MSRQNIHGPGMVLPTGELSKPLIDFLTGGASQTAIASVTASIATLDGRVTVLESSEFHWNGHGANGITVSGSGDEGYTFTLTATTDNVPEGSSLYFTTARAKAACVADAIVDSVTDVAPSQNAVFDALATKQPLDSDLAAIAALAPANDDVIQRKAGAWTNRTIAQLLTDLNLGALYQPLDAQLTDLAALTYGSNALKVIRVNAGETGWELATVSGGGSPPTGTGFRHVTSGVEDGAARYPSDAEVTFTDITTNNASTTKHGFLKKLSNVATEYMDGTGAWSTPAGGSAGAMTLLGTATVAGSATTTFTLSGLSLSSYKAFHIVAVLKSAGGASGSIYLFFNSDTTVTNYYYAQNYSNNNTGGYGSANSANAGSLYSTAQTTLDGIIQRDLAGYPRTRMRSHEGLFSVAALVSREWAHVRNNTANVTSISLSSSVASQFDIGSTFTVWGIT